jgi:DNA-binding transcriptional LysR family regulator
VPLLAVDATDQSIRIIRTNLEPRRIALVWHRDRYRSPATLAFIEISRQVCAGLAAELGVDTPPSP